LILDVWLECKPVQSLAKQHVLAQHRDREGAYNVVNLGAIGKAPP
jgi:hypothetical protein